MIIALYSDKPDRRGRLLIDPKMSVTRDVTTLANFVPREKP